MADAVVKRPFSSPVYGNCSLGQKISGDVMILRQMEEMGMVEILAKKKSQSEALEAKPLPSSPAGQVLNGGKSSTSETKPEPLPSTQATKSPHGATSSTDATPSGGTNTTKTSRKRRKSGRKAGQQRTSTG